MPNKHKQLVAHITLVTLCLTVLSQIREWFSISTFNDTYWAGLILFLLGVSFFLYRYFGSAQYGYKIISIVAVLVIGLLIFSYTQDFSACDENPVCDENPPDETPFNHPEDENNPTNTSTLTQTPEATSTQTATPEVPATPFTNSMGGSIGSATAPPVPNTPPPKPSCGTTLIIIEVIGETDWLYVVRPGDTLPIIAQLFLKDAARWPEIHDYNPEALGDLPIDGSPSKVYPGQRIVIPNVESPIIVKVELGDTVSNFGAIYYGYDYSSGRFWCVVYWQNRDRIGDNPSLIQIGQILYIFPLAPDPENSILVPPNLTFMQLLEAYGIPGVRASEICSLQEGKFGVDCEDIKPFDQIYVPNLPPPTKFKVGAGDTLEIIIMECYGEVTEYLKFVALTVNRGVIGDDPTFIHIGQTISLYGCKE